MDRLIGRILKFSRALGQAEDAVRDALNSARSAGGGGSLGPRGRGGIMQVAADEEAPRVRFDGLSLDEEDDPEQSPEVNAISRASRDVPCAKTPQCPGLVPFGQWLCLECAKYQRDMWLCPSCKSLSPTSHPLCDTRSCEGVRGSTGTALEPVLRDHAKIEIRKRAGIRAQRGRGGRGRGSDVGRADAGGRGSGSSN